MTTPSFRRLVGGLAVAVPVTMGFFSLLLAWRFDYPEVMDRPAEEVLTRLGRAAPAIPAYWLGVTVAAAGLVVLALALDRVLRDEIGDDPPWADRLPWLTGITTAGVAAGATIAVDVAQWTWLYPELGRRYVDPDSTAAARASLEVVWDAFHSYVGEGIGLYAATYSSAVWVFGLAWILLADRGRRRRSGWLAVAAGVLFVVSAAPGVSFDWYSRLNSIGFVLWSIWLVGIGIALRRADRLVSRGEPASSGGAGADGEAARLPAFLRRRPPVERYGDHPLAQPSRATTAPDQR